MTEYRVVEIVIAMIIFCLSVGAPVIKLNTSITKLTAAMQQFEKKLDENKTDNHEAHKRLWDHNDEQDKTLLEHDQRLHDLDGK